MLRVFAGRMRVVCVDALRRDGFVRAIQLERGNKSDHVQLPDSMVAGSSSRRRERIECQPTVQVPIF